MEQIEIAKSYEDAAKIIMVARANSMDISGVWHKLNRVANYISKTASQQLAETLN